MKKRFLALLVAIAMLLCTAAAFAENSTRLTFAVTDLKLSYDGTDIDLTGLDAELSAMLTDSGLTGLMLSLFSGSNYENEVATAQAQLDENGLTFGMTGISSLYSMDLSGYGVDISELSLMNMHTFLSSLDINAVFAALQAASAQSNADAVSQYYTVGDDGVITISVSREQGAALIASMNSDSSADSAFSAEGTVTPAADGSCVIAIAGEIFADDDAAPYTFDCDTAAGTFALIAGANSEVAVTGTFGTDENGAFALVGDVAASNTSLCQFAVNSAFEEDGTESSFTLTADGMNLELNFAYNSYSFAFVGTMDQNGEVSSAALSYTGETGSNGTGYTTVGRIDGSVVSGEMNASLSFGIVLADETMDSAEWAMTGTDSAIDIASMTDEQTSTMQSELQSMLINAVLSMSGDVPGIASIVGSMM